MSNNWEIAINDITAQKDNILLTLSHPNHGEVVGNLGIGEIEELHQAIGIALKRLTTTEE